MTKERKQKIKKMSLRIGAGFLAFAAGLAATFFLVPGRIRNIVFDDPVIEEPELTHFSRFVNKLMDTINVDSDESIKALDGRINALTVEWPDKNPELPNNKVKVDGSLAFAMRNLNDFDVTLDVGVDYNTKVVDLAVGYTGRDFYLGFQDLFIKSSYNSTKDLFNHLNTLFFNPAVEEGKGLGIDVDIDGVIDSLIGDLDLGSLLSGGVPDLDIEEKEIEGNKIQADLAIPLNPDDPAIELSLFLNKETNDLCGVNLKQIEIGGVKVSGEITFDISAENKVIPFDDENYSGHRNFKDKNFIEVINYKSWFTDIFNLLNQKTIGLDLAFSVDQVDEKGATNIGDILGAIDVDLSKFDLFDYIPKVINGETFSKEKVVTKSVTRAENGEETVVEKLLDNINAGIDLEVSRDDTKYANLNLTYAEQNAYLSLNDDVIKAKMDIESLNLIIDKISPLIEGDADEQARKLLRSPEIEEPQQEAGLFDFITSSPLVEAIKKGHYEGIIDVLESVTNTMDGVQLKLNLSSLGLGSNSVVELGLGATQNNDEMGVTSLKCHDIEMAEGIFQLDLETRPYRQENISKVLNDKENYQDMDFVTGVFDQVTDILDTKKTGFNLSGSVLGSDGLGMSFDGRGQLDYGTKFGYGNINIYNHKNAENPGEKTETHPVKVYVDNTSNDPEKNDMKLVYGANEKLKGKLSVSSLDDIVGVVKKIIDQADRRFMKFLDPIMKIIYRSAIGEIIDQKDYLKLASNGFIKSIKQNIDGNLELYLSKLLFADLVAENLLIRVNFVKDSNGVKKLSSLEIVNLVLSKDLGGKIINLNVDLLDYSEAYENPVNVNDTFMDFSSIATLLAFGIDSTELGSYHLTANAHVNALTVFNISVPLDFYIEVDGDQTKVYGRIIDVPYVIIVSNDAGALVSSEFVFEPAKHYNPNSDDTIGGYFHILRSEEHSGIFSTSTSQSYYRATSQGFLDNILDYILCGLIDFRFSIIDSIGHIELGGNNKKPVYEEMFNANGFVDKSTPAENKYQWDISMSLAKLTGIDALGSLDASLYGSNYDTEKGQRSYLNKLVANMQIQASIVAIKIDATINLVDIDPSARGWEDQYPDIETRFEKIVNIYNGMTEEQKTSYNKTYLDVPKNEYKKGIDSSFPSFLRP